MKNPNAVKLTNGRSQQLRNLAKARAGIGLIIAILIAWFSSWNAAVGRPEKLKLSTELSRLRTEFSEFQKKRDKEIVEMREAFSQTSAKKDFLVEGLTKILEQRKSQFPWLASAFADLGSLVAEQDARRLESKKHPAKKHANFARCLRKNMEMR